MTRIFKNSLTDLSGYVPYTGATADVDLGTHDLTATEIHGKGDFDIDWGTNQPKFSITTKSIFGGGNPAIPFLSGRANETTTGRYFAFDQSLYIVGDGTQGISPMIIMTEGQYDTIVSYIDVTGAYGQWTFQNYTAYPNPDFYFFTGTGMRVDNLLNVGSLLAGGSFTDWDGVSTLQVGGNSNLQNIFNTSDNTYDIGSATYHFKDEYLKGVLYMPVGATISDGSYTSIDPYGRALYGGSGGLSFTWFDGGVALNSGNVIYDKYGIGMATSIDPYNRTLNRPDGTTVFKWNDFNTVGEVNFNKFAPIGPNDVVFDGYGYAFDMNGNSLKMPSGSVISDGSQTSIDPYNRRLEVGNNGPTFIDWSGSNPNYAKISYDPTGPGSVLFGATNIIFPQYAQAVFQSGALITDSSFYTSIDPYNRKGYDPLGVEIFDYSDTGGNGFAIGHNGFQLYLAGSYGMSMTGTSYWYWNSNNAFLWTADALSGYVGKFSNTQSGSIGTEADIFLATYDGSAFYGAKAGKVKFATFYDNSDNKALDLSSYTAPKLSGLTSNGFLKTSSSDGTLTVDTTTYADVTVTPQISTGTSAPGSTPTKVGDIYIDTNAGDVYVSKGTSSSSDWVKVN